MFDLGSLLHQHLYLAIALGGLVEGETVAVLAGLAAHQGYASWWGVTLFAAMVNACVDQLWFLALDMTRIPLMEFALLNLPAALLWSAIFTGLGCLGGAAILALLERAHRYEPAIVIGVLLVGGLAWLAAQRWGRPRELVAHRTYWQSLERKRMTLRPELPADRARGKVLAESSQTA